MSEYDTFFPFSKRIQTFQLTLNMMHDIKFGTLYTAHWSKYGKNATQNCG